jgi:hypothetical protein
MMTCMGITSYKLRLLVVYGIDSHSLALAPLIDIDPFPIFWTVSIEKLMNTISPINILPHVKGRAQSTLRFLRIAYKDNTWFSSVQRVEKPRWVINS